MARRKRKQPKPPPRKRKPKAPNPPADTDSRDITVDDRPPITIPDDFRTVSHSKKRACLAAFCVSGNIGVAVAAVGISRRINEIWRKQDPDYAALWEIAREHAADILEAEAFRRAHSGVDEPVYQMGRRVGTIRRYSDTLLIFLLKAARPDKFGDPRFAGGAGPIIIDAQQVIAEFRKAAPALPMIDATPVNPGNEAPQ